MKAMIYENTLPTYPYRERVVISSGGQHYSTKALPKGQEEESTVMFNGGREDKSIDYFLNFILLANEMHTQISILEDYHYLYSTNMTLQRE
jgi:hypothetical protein